MAKATIYIGANTNQASSALKSMGSKVDSFSSGVGKMAKNVGKALVATTAAFASMAIVVGKKSVEAFIAQERAETRYATIAKTVAGATDEQIQHFKDLAAAMQETTVISDDVVLAGFSQLQSFTKSTDAVKILKDGLADLTVATYGVNATQEQMIQSSNMIGKALTGQLGAMTRAGVLVSDEYKAAFEEANTETERAAVIAKVLEDNYGGLAESARNTAEGGIQVLKNELSDMAEKIGSVIVPSITDAIPKISDAFEDALPAVISVFDSLMAVLNGEEGSQESLSESVATLFDGLSKSILENLPMLMHTGLSILEGILNGMLQADMSEKISELITILGEIINEHAEEILMLGWQIAVGVSEGILIGLGLKKKEVGNANVTTINEMLWKWRLSIKDFIERGKQTIKSVAQGILASAFTVYTNVRTSITNAISIVKSFIKDAIQAGKDIISGIAEGIRKNAWRVVNSIRDAINAALDWVRDKLKIGSPSKVFAEFGKNIMDGWSGGISSNQDQLTGAISSATGSILPSMQTTTNNYYSDSYYNTNSMSVNSALTSRETLLELRRMLDEVGTLENRRRGLVVT